jgi:HSP20 family protein
MSLVRFNPFRELEEIQGRLNRLFTEVPQRDEPFLYPDWAPPVDIQETPKEYSVTIDLPDVKKEDIKVALENGALSIEGQRQMEKEEKGKKYHRIERQYGQFYRRFTMPGEVDGAHVQAQFKDGVLKVTLPKSEAAAPRSVDIKVA